MQTTKGDVKTETVTFGAGCFWCVEAVFSRLKGVIEVKSGYSGGTVKTPTYKEVYAGRTGHAEVCQITYNPDVISFPEMLEVFWKTHDPTTLNRQGNDVGTQYRSVIFYHNDEQKRLAEEMKQRLNKEGIWKNPIVTEVVPFQAFYPAEEYHNDYFIKNLDQPYCTFVISPKVEKFEKTFMEYLKEDTK
jgi:peptide-methionine (S)-S-oxide reductase